MDAERKTAEAAVTKATKDLAAANKVIETLSPKFVEAQKVATRALRVLTYVKANPVLFDDFEDSVPPTPAYTIVPASQYDNAPMPPPNPVAVEVAPAIPHEAVHAPIVAPAEEPWEVADTAPTPEPPKKKRTRRTKEQMAADAAKTRGEVAEVVAPPAPEVQYREVEVQVGVDASGQPVFQKGRIPIEPTPAPAFAEPF